MLSDDVPPPHRPTQAQRLRVSLQRWLGFVALLGLVLVATVALPELGSWGVRPLEIRGLAGLATAPLLHADAGHLFSNAVALVVLGTLVGTVYPLSASRLVLAAWIGAGAFTWLLGRPSVHLGASGLVHGLFFALFTLAVLRRDRHAVVAAFVAILLFGGMLLTVLPHELRVSWEMHAGGALAGIVAGVVWRRRDPPPARAPYSWEIEEADARALEDAKAVEADTYEPARPGDVPVLWERPARDEARGTVLPFRRPGSADDPPR
ncbi:MAG: rhomboid family intramembrane serine protease [Lysobacteraceae bacterium]|jgi:membrane associated rhomboid family serine protease|nr:rhomboid family intramembrane serine protease [Xanthomonadaceae bacterium]MCZ8319522.1 rhomboid family intramembrane serine protease [Silanimonas sp.]